MAKFIFSSLFVASIHPCIFLEFKTFTFIENQSFLVLPVRATVRIRSLDHHSALEEEEGLNGDHSEDPNGLEMDLFPGDLNTLISSLNPWAWNSPSVPGSLQCKLLHTKYAQAYQSLLPNTSHTTLNRD